jgi:single-strand DNA-binding protein
MNQTIIAGHLGSDPEVRFTSSGKKVITLRLAARVRRTAKDKEDETIWWRVTIWGEQFDKMLPYFKKGSPLIVFGELSKPEIFTDREGRPQVSMNVTASQIFFSPFGRPDSHSHPQQQQSSESAFTPAEMASVGGGGQKELGRGMPAPSSFNDDEIPF